MEELKPCPFCGGQATLFVSENGGGVRVLCLKCRAQSKSCVDTLSYQKPTHAVRSVIDAWNKRV